MRRALSVSVSLLLLTLCGCSSASSSKAATPCTLGHSFAELPNCTPSPSASESSLPNPTVSSSAAELRAAGVAWAHAFLTGTVIDQYNLQGPECLSGVKPTPSLVPAAAAEVRRERGQIERSVGMSTATIQSKIVGVSVRNVSEKTGEAEVRYDLPVAVTGNDNWVTYEFVGGKWKVQDCHAPFGGSSQSAETATSTP